MITRAKGELTSSGAGSATASRITERDMKVWKTVNRFGMDEDGAVTVDWVVLTASVCGLVALAMAGLKGNMTSIGQKTEDFLSSQTINTTF